VPPSASGSGGKLNKGGFGMSFRTLVVVLFVFLMVAIGGFYHLAAEGVPVGVLILFAVGPVVFWDILSRLFYPEYKEDLKDWLRPRIEEWRQCRENNE